jgi:hypothetical protein
MGFKGNTTYIPRVFHTNNDVGRQARNGLQVSGFVETQAAHVARTRDILITDWLYGSLHLMEAMVPVSPIGDPTDTLPFRHANDTLTPADKRLLPLFRRFSLLMCEQLSAAMRRSAEVYLAFWRQYDVRGKGPEHLRGYPASVKVRQSCQKVPFVVPMTPFILFSGASH